MRSTVFIGLLLVATASFSADATLRFSSEDIDVEDLRAVFAINIYKFNLEGMTDGDYRLTLRERESAEAEWRNLFSESFDGSDDPGVYLRVSFTRRDGGFGRALLSDQEDVNFKVELCNENRCFMGMSTIIPVPLAKEDALVLWSHEDASASGDLHGDGVRFLTWKPSARRARETGDSVYPRAELILERVETE